MKNSFFYIPQSGSGWESTDIVRCQKRLALEIQRINRRFYFALALLLFLAFTIGAVSVSNPITLSKLPGPLSRMALSSKHWLSRTIDEGRYTWHSLASFNFPSKEVSFSTIERYVGEACQQHSVPPELVWAVIEVESNFDNNAVSPKGARGLMQLAPRTSLALNVRDPHNPKENIHAGTKYVAYLIKKYSGNKELALAAYNAGPTVVDRYGRIPPYRETKQYVKKVLSSYNKRLLGDLGSSTTSRG